MSASSDASSRTRACPSCPRSRRSGASSSRRFAGDGSSASRSSTSAGRGPSRPSAVEAALDGPHDRGGGAARQVPDPAARGRSGAGHAPADDRQPAARSASPSGPDGGSRSARRGCTAPGAHLRGSTRRRRRAAGSRTRAASATAVVLVGDELERVLRRRGSGSSRCRSELTAEALAGSRPGGRRRSSRSCSNQAGVAGIGNIYADEALHRAELHPLSPAGSMRPEHCEALREGIVEALEAGLANGGASIDDYRDARGERGSMQDEFLVHTREGEACPRCGGEIERIVVGGRSTYFCPAARCGCAARPRRRRAKRRRAMSEPFRRPTGFAVGHWTDAEGVTGCTVVIAPPERARRAWTCAAAGPAPARPDAIGPLAGTERGDGGAAHRRQRLRARRGRRRDALARGARAGLPDARRAGADRARGGHLRPRRGRPGGAAAGRGRLRGLRGGARRGVPERGRVGAGTGAAVGKILGRERGVPRRRRLCGGADRARRDGGGARGRQHLRRRDRRGRSGARGAAGRGGGAAVDRRS